MPTIHCETCGSALTVGTTFQNSVTVTCMKCGLRQPSGAESEAKIRQSWEQFTDLPFPVVTAARAMSLSNAIYKSANSGGEQVRLTTLNKVSAKKGSPTATMVNQFPIKGRSHGGSKDGSHVASVIVIDNKANATPRYSIYIVFRGSVGVKNDGGAGRDQANQDVNIDWRANFDNPMVAHSDNPSVRVHRGFQEILGSYQQSVEDALKMAVEMYGLNHHLVVTGHSQGAAHALLFAYHLRFKNAEQRLFCMPFSPPRVGDISFAVDFTQRITNNGGVVLPYDGEINFGSYLMVRGSDPVSVKMTHALSVPAAERNAIADKQLVLKKGPAVGTWEKKNQILTDIFFHPKYLVKIPSKWDLLVKGANHKPSWFRGRILSKLG